MASSIKAWCSYQNQEVKSIQFCYLIYRLYAKISSCSNKILYRWRKNFFLVPGSNPGSHTAFGCPCLFSPLFAETFFLSLSFITLVFWESRSQVFCRICLDLDLDLSDLTSGLVQDQHFWQEHHEVMLCISRHTTWFWAIDRHVTLHDLVRVACLAGLFNLMFKRNCLPRKPVCPATRAWAIPIFLPPAHKVSVLVAPTPPPPSFLPSAGI